MKKVFVEETVFSRKSLQKINLREKIFSFALSAKMFVAFDDDLLRDKLEFFLCLMMIFWHLFKRIFFELAALSLCAHVFKDLRVRLFLFERLALTLCAHAHITIAAQVEP